jgi:uncharacterized DUF497 family protein
MRKPPWNLEDFRLIIGSTQVDYDLAKEDTNRRKHGYSLESAVSFFERLLLFDQTPFISRDASTTTERRHEHMTVDEGKIIFLVTTMRSDETVRVISVRRAHAEERNTFFQYTGFKEFVTGDPTV